MNTFALHDLALGIIGFFSEILGTVSGFGSSTYFVPFALYFEKFTLVITLTAILHTISNASKIHLFKQGFDKKFFLRMALPSMLFCALGAQLIPQVDLKVIKIILGLLLVSYCILKYFNFFSAPKMGVKVTFAVSSLSGFLTGLLGTGGALRGLAISSLGVSKESFIFLSSIMDIGGDLIRLVIYLKDGYMQWDQWYYLPLLFIAATLGTRIGKSIVGRMSQAFFDKIVLLFTFGSGVMLIYNSFIN